jgi:hypothetical protein
MISKTWMWALAGLMILIMGGQGCHYLHPEQLHKWNRGPDTMPSSDYSFSIPDPPMPTEVALNQSDAAKGSCASNACAE